MTSSLDLIRIAGGPLETNAFIVTDRSTRESLVIDAPPETHDAIVDSVRNGRMTVASIVLTHAHWDHIVDANALRESLETRIIVHPNADSRLAQEHGADTSIPYTIAPIIPDDHTDNGDTVSVGAESLAVMFLPGHDPAHIVLYHEGDRILLGGDVLFPGGHGRIDIPGADEQAMLQSLTRLLTLPDDVTVYPGHGRETTIGAERAWMTQMTTSIR